MAQLQKNLFAAMLPNLNLRNAPLFALYYTFYNQNEKIYLCDKQFFLNSNDFTLNEVLKNGTELFSLQSVAH